MAKSKNSRPNAAAWLAAKNAQEQRKSVGISKEKCLEALRKKKGEKLEGPPEAYVLREVSKRKTGGRNRLEKPKCGLCLKCFRDVFDRRLHMLFHGGKQALICIHCELDGKRPSQCYFLNGDTHRRHLLRHDLSIAELKEGTADEIELAERLQLVYPISTDLFNELQSKLRDNSNPWRWTKISPHDKNTKDLANCKVWDVQWNFKNKETGKFEVTVCDMNSITIRTGAIWGIKHLCDEAEISFKHKYLDQTTAPLWYSAYKNEYEIQKITAHYPVSAKSKNQVTSYRITWALGSESTVKIKNLTNCKQAVKEYWKNK